MFSITSFSFFVFLALAVLVYYCIPSKIRWCWLLISSAIFFVLSSGWEMIPYLLYGIVVTYTGAWLIQYKCKTDRQRKIVLIITLILTLIELVVLKYLNFFIATGNVFGKLFHLNIGLTSLSMIAPIGISYYTLSIIGYVIDVYRQTIAAQKNPFKFALFTCYFPQLVSGPITRYGEMEPQFFGKRTFDPKRIQFGLERMLWGLFKKLVISDRLAIIVSTVYADFYNYNGFYILFAVFIFAFRLYADFSGCMDIVLGASEIFGITLPENFDTPFFSETISEFWRRWHITLGLWSKDYILYPLLKSDGMQRLNTWSRKKFGKKIGKKIPTDLALIVVWIMIGLWHGGSYQFLFISGILPGFYLISGDLLHPFFVKMAQKCKLNTTCFSYKLFRCLRTTLLMCSCWILVPAGSLMQGLHVVEQMLTHFNPWILFDDSIFGLGLDQKDFFLIFVALLIVLVVDILHKRGIHLRESFSKQNLAFQWIVLYIAIFAVLIFGIYGPGYNPVDFIYGGF